MGLQTNIQTLLNKKTHNLAKINWCTSLLIYCFDQMAVGKMIFDQETQHQKLITQAAITIY
jgi:hypothetical protein